MRRGASPALLKSKVGGVNSKLRFCFKGEFIFLSQSTSKFEKPPGDEGEALGQELSNRSVVQGGVMNSRGIEEG